MKGLPFIIISLLLVTASCKTIETKEVLTFDDSVKQIIFFSDESKYQYEAPYYDAIIELKKEFPDEVKNMITFSPTKAKEYYDTFKVKECPAILVVYNKEIVVRIDGTNSKDQIVKPISVALSSDS